jgi:hypothetical protein
MELKHFAVFELVDRATYDAEGDKALDRFNPKILEAIEGIREFFAVPMIINNWYLGGSFQWRGWRTPEKAAELGAPNSEHAKGNAFDFDIQGLTAQQVRDKIVANQDNPLLANITRLEANTTWVHADCKELVLPEKRIYLFHA